MLQTWQQWEEVVMGGRELELDTANFVPGIGGVVAGTPRGSVTRGDVKVAGLLAGGLVMDAWKAAGGASACRARG